MQGSPLPLPNFFIDCEIKISTNLQAGNMKKYWLGKGTGLNPVSLVHVIKQVVARIFACPRQYLCQKNKKQVVSKYK
jgi:hypothetical protein